MLKIKQSNGEEKDMKREDSINLNLVIVPVFGHISTSCLLWNSTPTREDQISYNNVFSLFGIADLWEVAVQYEKDDTGQEGQDSDPHSVAAGTVIAIEHAVGFHLCWRVNIALCSDGCKDHNRK